MKQMLAIAKTDPSNLWLQKPDWSFTDEWPEAWMTSNPVEARDRLADTEAAADAADSDEEFTVVLLTFTKEDDVVTLEKAQAVDVHA